VADEQHGHSIRYGGFPPVPESRPQIALPVSVCCWKILYIIRHRKASIFRRTA
jgi:hypothetical protein